MEQKDENPFQVDTITKDSEGDRALLQEMIVHFADVRAAHMAGES